LIFIFSEQAKLDADNIGDFIALDNPIRAASFTSELLESASKIVDFPNSNFLVSKRFSLRRKIHGNYAIYYRLSSNQVTVLRIVHTARKTKIRDIL
jgi:toxin ParE1/3/4